MDPITLTALIIFAITYLGIIFTRLPGMNIDRPSAAFFGAVAMILFGVLPFGEAIAAIDFNTIALLLGMMIIVATLQLDGFFSLIAATTIAWAKTRFRLMFIITFVTGISSAFLVNDAVVLLFTPVIIVLCRSAGLNPVPYLIAEILASNAGSVMSITGNPQNMLIGINSGLGYTEFLVRLLPVSIISMAVIVGVMRMLYQEEFRDKKPLAFKGERFTYHLRSMRWSVSVFAGVMVVFFFNHRLGIPIPMVAWPGHPCAHSRENPALRNHPAGGLGPVIVLRLLIYCGTCRRKTGLLGQVTGGGILSESTAACGSSRIECLMSQIISNVPFTVVMLPLMKSTGSDVLWLALASASTLAGMPRL